MLTARRCWRSPLGQQLTRWDSGVARISASVLIEPPSYAAPLMWAALDPPTVWRTRWQISSSWQASSPSSRPAPVSASAQAGTSPTAHAGRATEVALHRTSLGEILSTGSGVTLMSSREIARTAIAVSRSAVAPRCGRRSRAAGADGCTGVRTARCCPRSSCPRAQPGTYAGHPLYLYPAATADRATLPTLEQTSSGGSGTRSMRRRRRGRSPSHAISVVLDQRSQHAPVLTVLKFLVPALAASLTLAACGGSSSSNTSKLLFVCRHCACKRRHLRARPARWSSRPRRTRRWARPCSSTRRYDAVQPER